MSATSVSPGTASSHRSALRPLFSALLVLLVLPCLPAKADGEHVRMTAEVTIGDDSLPPAGSKASFSFNCPSIRTPWGSPGPTYYIYLDQGSNQLPPVTYSARCCALNNPDSCAEELRPDDNEGRAFVYFSAACTVGGEPTWCTGGYASPWRYRNCAHGCDYGTFSLYASYGSVAGHVKYYDGTPAEGVTVTASCADGSYSVATGSDGNYTFTTGLLPRPFHADSIEPFPVPTSNNWGLPVDAPPFPGEGPGSKTWLISAGGKMDTKIVESSKESTAHFTIELPKPDPTDNRPPDPCGGPDGPSDPCEPPADPGGPVSVTSGNVYLDQVDAAMPGLRTALEFQRSYNSLDAMKSIGGAFGIGWTHTYEKGLVPVGPRVMALREGNGKRVYFTDRAGSGAWKPHTPSRHRSGIVGSGTSFVRRFRVGGSETYDQGRLVSTTDRYGRSTTLTYDESGRLKEIHDPGGRTLTLAYMTLPMGGEQRIHTLSGPAGVLATYEYDARHMLSRVTYADGTGFTFEYTASHLASGQYSAVQLVAVADLTGRVIERHDYQDGKGITSEVADGVERYTLTYEDGRTLVTDALGRTTIWEFSTINEMKYVTKRTGPCGTCGGGGLSEEWVRDERGRITAHRNGAGEETHYVYDENGDITSVTNALGHTTSYTYDDQGRMLTTTAPDGGTTTYAYGPDGPTSITDPLNRTTTLTYDGGQLTAVTDPRGRTTTIARNEYGDVIAVTDPLQHVTRFGRDPLGRRTTVTDALGHVTTATYDPGDRIRRLLWADGTSIEFAHDQAGRLTSTTDALGGKTSYAYDLYGRLEAVVNALGGATRYTYDAMGRVTSRTDARGQRTDFEYNAGDRVQQITYPGGASETFGYDLAGRLKTRVDRKGVTTSWERDALGRLTRKIHSDGTPATAYTYDEGQAIGRLTAADNEAAALRWTYDLAGQLLSEESVRSPSLVSYAFDLDGNPASLSLDGQAHLTYGYDDASRVSSITRGTEVFGFSHDDAGRRVSMSFPNGVTTSYAYDETDRLMSLHAALNETVVSFWGYSYDRVGSRLSKTTGDATETYGYDALYRLRSAQRTGPLPEAWQYGYDSVGNRTSMQAGDAVLTSNYDERNQLRASSGGGRVLWRGTIDEPGSVTFTSALVNGQPARMLGGNVFEATLDMVPGTNTVSVEAADSSGNAATKTYTIEVPATGVTYTYDSNGNLVTKTDGPGTWTYDWDAENRLARVTKNGEEMARYRYDPLGRRVQKVTAAGTSTYTYAGLDILQERLNGTLRVTYIHGPGIDEPLARLDAAGTPTYYHADGLGSIVRLSSPAGAVVASRQYDAWGNLEIGGEEPGYAYTGREWDPEIGLYYYRARYYDPKTGRFISEDPIGFEGGSNFYGYALNSPAVFSDPQGLRPGNQYSTQLKAGRASLRYYWCHSWRKNREYCMKIYRNGNGTFSYTPAHFYSGEYGIDHCQVPRAPVGTTPAGDAHTHGAPSPQYQGERFSDTDKGGWKTEGAWPKYLGTPSGEARMWSPGMGADSNGEKVEDLPPCCGPFYDSEGRPTGQRP